MVFVEAEKAKRFSGFFLSGVSPPHDDLLFSTAKKVGKNAALQRRLYPRPSGRSRTHPAYCKCIKKECRARTTRAAILPASGSALMGYKAENSINRIEEFNKSPIIINYSLERY
jgi:hypothetical protein